jgi:electron transfer flavoprotein alpha subunit
LLLFSNTGDSDKTKAALLRQLNRICHKDLPAPSKIYLASNPLLSHYMKPAFLNVIKSFIAVSNYTSILSYSSTLGNYIIPNLAATYHTQPITDVIAIRKSFFYFDFQAVFFLLDKDDILSRFVYTSNAVQEYKYTPKIKFITISPHKFKIPHAIDAQIEMEFNVIDFSNFVSKEKENKLNFIEEITHDSSDFLETAQIVSFYSLYLIIFR